MVDEVDRYISHIQFFLEHSTCYALKAPPLPTQSVNSVNTVNQTPKIEEKVDRGDEVDELGGYPPLSKKHSMCFFSTFEKLPNSVNSVNYPSTKQAISLFASSPQNRPREQVGHIQISDAMSASLGGQQLAVDSKNVKTHQKMVAKKGGIDASD